MRDWSQTSSIARRLLWRRGPPLRSPDVCSGGGVRFFNRQTFAPADAIPSSNTSPVVEVIAAKRPTSRRETRTTRRCAAINRNVITQSRPAARRRYRTRPKRQGGFWNFWESTMGIRNPDHRRLKQPLLYLSLYFKDNRQEYYDRLNAVRQTGDWE